MAKKKKSPAQKKAELAAAEKKRIRQEISAGKARSAEVFKTAESQLAGFKAEAEALQDTMAARQAQIDADIAAGETALAQADADVRLANTASDYAEAFKTIQQGEDEDEESSDVLAQFYAKIAEDARLQKRAAGESAYNLLFEQFSQYGLGSLVEPLRGFIEDGLSPAEFTLRLRGTDAYKKRFAANAKRIGAGLRALSEAEYIELEDQYQNVMRQYGLPETYYTRGELGRQEGFEKFLAGDVSPVELEERIQTAQRRVEQAAPQIKTALSQYYGDEISNGDILAYVLDPSKAIEDIKRKVTAAEIGGAAAQFGLGATRARAEELGRYGVTAQQAREGFQTIAEILPRGSQLAEIYSKQGLGPYNQAVAESEVFATPGATEAQRKRKQLTQLEQAAFSGTSGMAQGALARDRAGAI